MHDLIQWCGALACRRAALAAFATTTVLLAACGGGGGAAQTPPVAVAPPVAPVAPVQPAPSSSIVELEISGIGSGSVTSSMAWPGAGSERKGTLQLRTQALSNLAQGLDFRLQSAGVVDVGARGAGGMRYITATYDIRNALFCATAGNCTPYSTARKNLTFLGVITPTSINNTAISNFVRFDNSAASPALAVQLLPTHGMDSTGTTVLPEAASLQVYREAELPTADPAATSVLPWGFVVRNVNDGGRTLPASPASGRFDGRITFAFKLPLQAVATDDAFKISMRFQVTQDTVTRITRSAEEFGYAGDVAANQRADAAGATDTVVPCDRLARVFTGYPICNVRVAGLASAPSAVMWPLSGLPRFLSAPINLDNAPLRPGFILSTSMPMNAPTGTTLVVHGSQTGTRTLTGAYAGVVEGGATFGRPNQLIFRLRDTDLPFLRGETISFTATAGNAPVTGPGLSALVGQFKTVGSVPGSWGTFERSVGFETPSGTMDFAVGDVDGDGQLDIVMVGGATNTVVVSNFGFGSTSFPSGASTPRSVSLGDVNGDGRLDILVSHHGNDSVSVLLRNAANNGFLTAQHYLVGADPAGLAVGDLNGDGRLDIVVANSQGQSVSVLLRNAANTGFMTAVNYAAGEFPMSVSLADLNEDGALDMIVPSSFNDTVTVYLNNGSGLFVNPVSYAMGAGPTKALLRDVNGDGVLDMLVPSSSSSSGISRISIRLGTGSGAFGDLTEVDPGWLTSSMDVGDVDGDGLADLVVTPRNRRVIRVMRGDGAGGFSAPVEFAGLPDSGALKLLGSVVLADINRDGRLDVLALAHDQSFDYFIFPGDAFGGQVVSWLGR